MSCGGLCAINFAAKYPDLVSVLYLDAPVVNLLSCPMGFGVGEPLGEGDAGWREIRDAIRRTLGARSLDGVKRRVRQGMGRCQAGFCTPGAIAILAEELGIPEEQVTKNRPGSELLVREDEI